MYTDFLIGVIRGKKLNNQTVSAALCYFCSMKKCFSIFSIFLILLLVQTNAVAQCSLCTKTAQQLGEGPASGLNAGII
jgi:hypothetical protein